MSMSLHINTEVLVSYILEHEGEFERLEKQATQKHYSLKEEFKHLSLSKNASVLDAGCGSGLVSRFLVEQEPTIKVSAVDFSDIRIAQAKKNNPPNYDQITFERADLNELPFADNTFDFVVSRFVYEYLPNPIHTTKELHRVLKPGGKIYLIDLDGVFLNFWTTDEKLNSQIKKISESIDIDLYVGRKLVSFVKKNKFKNIKWDMSAHAFKSSLEISEERSNNKERLQFAIPTLKQIFGNIEDIEQFQKTYLAHMSTDEAGIMFFNKFTVIAEK